MFKVLSILLLLAINIDESKIRYGNINNFKDGDKIAVVDSKAVYKEIPSYKTIIKESLKQGTARYQILMSKATATFKRSMKSYARTGSFVLIVEKGGISDYTVTDGTSGIIKEIKK